MIARSTLTPHRGATVDLAKRTRGCLAVMAALAALAAAAPSIASADPPARVTIVAVFEPISYGDNAYVNGQLFGLAQGGQVVAIEQSAAPFTDWTPIGQVTSDAAGYYSFKLHPTQTLRYRTSSQGVPSDYPVQIDVAPRISFKAMAAGRTSVRFSGTFSPALVGQGVAIQRRSTTGAWVTVANARLRNGTTFQGRLRARRPLTLRAFIRRSGAYLAGASKSVRVAPGRG
jgi:hypothetical protein